MILYKLSDYLKSRSRAAILDMAQELEIAPAALRDMLKILERKNLVRKLPEGTLCGGGCCKCSVADIELYEWVGSGGTQGNRMKR